MGIPSFGYNKDVLLSLSLLGLLLEFTLSHRFFLLQSTLDAIVSKFQGGILPLAALASDPSFAKNLASLTLIAPITFVGNITSPVLNMWGTGFSPDEVNVGQLLRVPVIIEFLDLLCQRALIIAPHLLMPQASCNLEDGLEVVSYLRHHSNNLTLAIHSGTKPSLPQLFCVDSN